MHFCKPVVRRIKLAVYMLYTAKRKRTAPFLVPRACESTGYIRFQADFGKNADGVVYKNEVEFRQLGEGRLVEFPRPLDVGVRQGRIAGHCPDASVAIRS
jgi:hypothetical protein